MLPNKRKTLSDLERHSDRRYAKMTYEKFGELLHHKIRNLMKPTLYSIPTVESLRDSVDYLTSYYEHKLTS